jgi:hypothetical protein
MYFGIRVWGRMVFGSLGLDGVSLSSFCRVLFGHMRLSILPCMLSVVCYFERGAGELGFRWTCGILMGNNANLVVSNILFLGDQDGISDQSCVGPGQSEIKK